MLARKVLKSVGASQESAQITFRDEANNSPPRQEQAKEEKKGDQRTPIIT